MKNTFPAKNILITGAGGFVGSNFVSYFSKIGVKITACYRKIPKINFEKHRLEIIDLTSEQDCERVFKGHDIVLNFASLDGNWEYKSKNSLNIFIMNILINLNVFQASKNAGVKTVLTMSSIDVYDPNIKGEIDESEKNVRLNIFDGNGYAWSKIIVEKIAEYYSENHKIQTLVLRSGNLYGKGDSFEKKRVIANFVDLARNNKRIIISKVKFKKIPFLHINDFIQIVLKLLTINNSHTLNIVSSKYISLLTLSKLVIKSFKSESTINFLHEKKIKQFERSYSIKKLIKLIRYKEQVKLNRKTLISDY